MRPREHARGEPGGVVGDAGVYIDRRAEFVRSPEADKLANAAHFEVVPRRMLAMGNNGFAYPGVTFTPGVLAPLRPRPLHRPRPPLRPPHRGPAGCARRPGRQPQAAGDRSGREILEGSLDDRAESPRAVRPQPPDPGRLDARHQGEFGLPRAARFTDVLQFWSKVEGLTIHNRPGINPASADPSTQPVTQIDVALSEAVVRQLARGMFAMPETEAAATALEATATPAERAAATDVATERDLLIKLVARDIGTVTGTPARDVHVVNALGATHLDFPHMLVVRGPAAFPH